MSEVDRHRKIILGLVGRIAVHHSLVSSASGIYSLSDIRRLLVDEDLDFAGVAVEILLIAIVADIADSLPDDVLDIDFGMRGDLTGDDDDSCRRKAFARDSG